jgi:hypothetical protein
MSLSEVAYRARQEASKIVDRTRPGAVRTPAETVELFTRRAPEFADPSGALDRFRSIVRHRFFAGATSPAAAALVRSVAPESCAAIVASAARVTRGRFDLLGYSQLAFGDPIDWHLDPVSGRRAPEVHWSRIDPLDAAAVGDAKVIWELSRHQWLVTLAQAHLFTGDLRYVRAAAEYFDAWIAANPPAVGINWASSLELAYRGIAWCWAIVLLRDSEFLTPERFVDAAAGLWLQMRHVERYLSRYHSPNTHLTGEALGLFYAGVLFPEFPEAARWRETGRRLLIAESERQILPDGVYFEQATAYQRYTADIYLHFLILAAQNGIPVPATVSTRLDRMLDALQALRWPDGALPLVGDDDGGWLLPLAPRTPDDCRGTLALGAALTGRADLKWAIEPFAPEVAWLLGEAGARQYERIAAQPPAEPSRLFSAGGVAVMRSGWDRDAHQLIFDVGPLGCPLSSAHGHADLLSIQCAAFGEPYVIDPGTFCYTPQPAWRNYFRSTAAHSTVEIDGRPQAEPAGYFSWSTKPIARLREWQTTPELDFVDGDHAAYASLPDPVRHRRRVLFVKPHYWIVVDDLSGADSHRVDLRFQLASRPVSAQAPWVVVAGRNGGGLWIGAFCSAALELNLRQGELHPIEGWTSSDYGRRRPSPVAIYSTVTRLPVRIISLLLPVERLGDGAPPRVEEMREASGALAGLTLTDARESIRVSDDVVRVEWRDGRSS